MVYGPVGAFLAEYFPSRIRYTSVSVPYHIGNGRGGGLVPFITSAAFLSTGSVGYALIYPIVVPAVCFIICLFSACAETRHISIWEPDEGQGCSRVVSLPPGGAVAGPARLVPPKIVAMFRSAQPFTPPAPHPCTR